MAVSSFLTILAFSPVSYHGPPNLSIRPFRPFVHAAMPADMSSSSNIIQPSPATHHDKLFHATPLPPLSVHGFYLPQMLCGFPAMRNPHYESFKERLFSWLFEWAEPETETQRIFMIESDIPGLVCSILPKCKRLDRLELLCRLCLWVGCIDDICDDPSGGEAKLRPFGEVINVFEKAMEGHELAATSDGGHIKAICSILEAIRQDVSPRLYKRLVEGIGSFLRSSQSEDAVDEACDMIERKERDFIGLLNEVRVSNESMGKPEVDVYVESLPYLVSGHLEWYYTSARFHGVGHSVKNLREGYFVMDPHTTIVLPRNPSNTT